APLAFIASGGDGCISSVANIVPGLCRTIFSCCRQENWQAARALHSRSVPLATLLAKEGPAALKVAMSALGLVRPGLRLPLVEPDAATARDITRAVSSIAD